MSRFSFQSNGSGDYDVFDGQKQISSGLSLQEAEETVNRLNNQEKQPVEKTVK